ncbi:polyadenylate-binding protein 1-A-like [Hemibagrus wyckioides]|uniref:polyadenylate-binding protein 1-A-like n=1 Tax=Hemibagrus wyckioides TaxID=337641 RepID=UPI00266C58C8|nr:polyadenylate-binding protein 1-A-like [Hemibagrus wyckioides]
MLELDDQVQMAHDYLLPLVEQIHPTEADKITWMLVEPENNYNIMNMIREPELLCAKQTLKMIFSDSNKKKRGKRKNK